MTLFIILSFKLKWLKLDRSVNNWKRRVSTKRISLACIWGKDDTLDTYLLEEFEFRWNNSLVCLSDGNIWKKAFFESFKSGNLWVLLKCIFEQ
jgi:hypothetical protein